MGPLLIKSSQSNFNLRSPDSYSARSYLIATVPGRYGRKGKSANYLKSFTALWLGLFSKGHHHTGHVLCVAIQLTLLFCKGRKRNQFSQIYDFHHRLLSRSCAFSVLRTGCPNPNCISNTNLQKNVEIPKLSCIFYK